MTANGEAHTLARTVFSSSAGREDPLTSRLGLLGLATSQSEADVRRHNRARSRHANLNLMGLVHSLHTMDNMPRHTTAKATKQHTSKGTAPNRANTHTHTTLTTAHPRPALRTAREVTPLPDATRGTRSCIPCWAMRGGHGDSAVRTPATGQTLRTRRRCGVQAKKN